MDIESKEILLTFKDSQYYAPIIKLLRQIEIKSENDLLYCPSEDSERVLECRALLEGCRKTLRSFQGELNLLGKSAE